MAEPVKRRHKRPRPQTSCATCHRRKVKCNQQQPCEPCIRHGCAEECRFDGVPAKRGHDRSNPVTQQGHDSSPDQGISTADGVLHVEEHSRQDFPRLQPEVSTSERQSQLRSVLLLNQTFSQSGRKVPPKASSLPTHDWSQSSGHIRGRTHTSWLLHTFDPLLMYAGRHSLSEKQLQEDGTYAIRNSELTMPISGADSQETFSAEYIFDELPPVKTGYDLILRYFETFDTIYPLINRDTFPADYNAMLNDPKTVPLSFVVKVLLMQALANATFSEPLLSSCTVSRLLNFSASFPSSILALGELNIEIVRLFALWSLTEQVLRQDATAAYIRSGACVRAAMALGIHRVEERPSHNYENARCLWEAILDLDLHACLAAGLPPNAPSAGTFEPVNPAVDVPVLSPDAIFDDFIPEAASLILARSLPVRQKIITTLNGNEHIQFETFVKLSTELTKAMAPVSSSTETLSSKTKTFQYRYLSFTYGRFLAALHRPSAMLDHPAFFLSRNMTVRLSKQYLKELTAVHQGKAKTDPFASLLTCQGIMFKTEALQAVMALCHELFRDGESGFGTQGASALLGHADEKKEAEQIIRALLDVLDARHVSERLYLVAYMTLAHVDAEKRFAKGSAEYIEAMMEAGSEAEKRLRC